MNIRQSGFLLVFCTMTWGVFLLLSNVVEAASSLPDQTTDMLTNQGHTLFQKGDQLLKEGDLEQSLNVFNQALAHFLSARDRQMEGETLVKIGEIYTNLGEYQKALEYLRSALRIFQELDNHEDEGGTLTYIGIVHFMRSRYEQALEAFEQALKLSEAANDLEVTGVTLNWIGEAYRRLGQFSRSIEYYQQALKIAIEVRDPISEGRNRANIGSAYVELGQYWEAFQTYQQALPILYQAGDLQGVGNLYLNFGSTYSRLGDYQKALEHFRKAQEILGEVNDQRSEAIALTGIGLVYDERCQDNPIYCLKALATYQEALMIQETINDPGGQANTLHNMGGGYDRLGWETNIPAYHRQALEFYQDSLVMTEEIDELTAQARTLNNIAEVHLRLSFHKDQTKHLHQAMASLRKALTVQQKIGDRAGEWLSLSNIGWVLDRQGKFQEALETNRKAIELLERLIASVGGIEEFKAGLSAQASETYQRTILLLTHMEQPEQAFEFSERARARVLLDQLGNIRLHARDNADEALIQQERRVRLELVEMERRLSDQLSRPEAQQDHELMNFLKQQQEQKQNAYEEILLQLKVSNPEYTSLVRVDPLRLDDLQQLLRQRERDLQQEMLLLSYFVTPQSTLAFIISPDSFIIKKLPVSESELTKAITTFQNFIASDESSSNELEDLYAWLIAPIKKHLTTPVIGIIPHGILHYLPFAALFDGKRYLHDEYTLFYLPSASVLQFVQSKPQSNGKPILAMAYSDADTAEEGSHLPYAEQEVQGISKLFKTTALTEDDATEATFRKQAGDFFILHLAAHGELNPSSPLLSHILLSPDKAGEYDGKLEVHEVYELNLNYADLVVLSACETKLGKRSRGDDIIGLNRAFLYAGASSVIATLWKVNDFTTQQFMITFYKHLKQGKSKAEALRAAQQKIRSKYPHPYYWAGFVLTGDPGTISAQVPWVYILGIGLIGGGILVTLLLKMKRK